MAGNYKIKIEPILNTASLNKQLNETKKLKVAGQSSGTSWASGFTKAVTERFKYSIANALIYGTQNAIKDMVANVRELDKAQVELKKVTDLSGKSLEKFTEQAYKMSGSVAKTGTEIIQASTEFAKQGFDTNTALQLANVASQFQNIADTEIDAATAAKFINSQLKAFGNTTGFKDLATDAEKATRVIDSVNEVANNFGVGTNDLQMALTKTSAAMKGYGNSYAETIGLITAGTEVMPNQASKVARGWRSIGANILKLAQDTDTLEAANGKVKVALKDSNGELRSTFAILQDLYPQWQTLNNEERSSLALMLSGKTQTEVFQATMDNFTHAIEANETAMESQGSAARENAKYLDSIEGKIKAFQSAWEQLSYHVMSSDFIKSVVSIGTELIKILDKLVQDIGTLPTLIGILGSAFGVLKLSKLVTGFLGLGEAIEGVAVAEEAVATASGGTLLTKLGALGSALLPLAPALLALGGAFIYANHQYKNSFKGKLEEYEKLGDEIENIKSQIDDLESKEGALTSEEESRLSILKMQLKVLEQQEQLKSKQLTNAFNQDAKEKMHGKTHMEQGQVVTEREDLTGDKYIKAAEKRFELQKKIKHLEDEQRMHPLTEEQTKQLEEYNKELDKVYTNEYNALEKLIEEHDALANVDYKQLTADGKAWYDNTHKAYLEALSDVESVREAVGNAIDTFGSAQFDAWEIDVSSLESADDLVAQIKEKIEGMDDDAEITFRVKNDEGGFDEITKKKSELTQEDMDAIIHFNETGIETVEAEANNASRTREAIVNVLQEGAQSVSGIIDDAAKARDSEISVSQTGASTAKSAIDSAAKNRTTVINVVAKGISAVKNALSGIGHASGKRKGEQGGLAWLGDEGSVSSPKPELVVSDDGTAYLAGTSGWELHDVKSSDTVYSYSDTKKLLGGSQIFAGSVDELPRYKKGKKKKKKKQTKQEKRKAIRKKASKKTKEKWEKEFDKKLKDLQYKAKVNHWTDAKYQAEYKKLYDKYYNKATLEQLRDYNEEREEYQNKVAQETFNRRIGNIGMGHGNLADLVADINKNVNLSADEKTDMLAEAYKASVEYNLKEYQNGKNTRAKVVQDIKNYYKTRGKYDEDYYKMLDELREADQKKEVERLKKLEEQQENKLTLAQKYLNKELNAIEKQIEAEKEQEENEKKLVELQKELNKAKSQTIRVYKEGQGFVYEQDAEAIKEAQDALDEFTSSQTQTALEKKAEQLRAILDLFDEMEENSAIHELELALGVTSLSGLTGGNLGTNISKWTNWIKTVIATQVAYGDLAEQVGNLSGADIDKWLGDVLSGGNHEVSSSTISQYLNKHSFASGTISAPGGLSRVAERLGGELVWLGKGDSVYSNAVSKNLMEWGRYNPAQVLSHSNSTANQIFNFDKIVLPNVRNANDFYMELQKLPNIAIQQSIRRS